MPKDVCKERKPLRQRTSSF